MAWALVHPPDRGVRAGAREADGAVGGSAADAVAAAGVGTLAAGAHAPSSEAARAIAATRSNP